MIRATPHSTSRSGQHARLLLRLALDHLAVNPLISFLQPVAEPNAGSPSQILPDQRIVAIAAIDPLGRLQIVSAFELDARDVLHDVNQPVDRDNLAAAQVYRLADVAGHDCLGAAQAIIDVHKTARLLAAPPNLDLMIAG